MFFKNDIAIYWKLVFILYKTTIAWNSNFFNVFQIGVLQHLGKQFYRHFYITMKQLWLNYSVKYGIITNLVKSAWSMATLFRIYENVCNEKKK